MHLMQAIPTPDRGWNGLVHPPLSAASSEAVGSPRCLEFSDLGPPASFLAVSAEDHRPGSATMQGGDLPGGSIPASAAAVACSRWPGLSQGQSASTLGPCCPAWGAPATRHRRRRRTRLPLPLPLQAAGRSIAPSSLLPRSPCQSPSPARRSWFPLPPGCNARRACACLPGGAALPRHAQPLENTCLCCPASSMRPAQGDTGVGRIFGAPLIESSASCCPANHLDPADQRAITGERKGGRDHDRSPPGQAPLRAGVGCLPVLASAVQAARLHPRHGKWQQRCPHGASATGWLVLLHTWQAGSHPSSCCQADVPLLLGAPPLPLTLPAGEVQLPGGKLQEGSQADKAAAGLWHPARGGQVSSAETCINVSGGHAVSLPRLTACPPETITAARPLLS